MSETVQIALITLFASISSSFIASYFANNSTKKDRSFKAQELLYARKIEAYTAFFSAYHVFIDIMISSADDKMSVNRVLNQFAEKYSLASLLAPKCVAEQMFTLFALCSDHALEHAARDNVAAQYALVRNALHDDLEKTKPG